MSVKIRLRVVGKKKQHNYRIVAIESRNPRDGKYLEQLGWYNPHSKELQIDEAGIKKWQDKGAIVTDAVEALIKRWDSKAGKDTEKKQKTKKRKKTKKSKVTGVSKETEENEETKESEESKESKEIEDNKETEKSKETGEVTDVEGTDNVHSKVTGGST